MTLGIELNRDAYFDIVVAGGGGFFHLVASL